MAKNFRINYSPIVYIRKIEQLNGKSVAEVAKYSIKSIDYIKKGADIEILDNALNNKRLISYGGCIKILKQQILKKKKIEEEFEEELKNGKNGSELFMSGILKQKCIEN